ncbi:MAG: hypothetical protein KAY37_14005, partial [Phycisphaerae bacterium]|nr:hypothetical protein [Phycisphaerae bacterium]
WSAIAIDSEWSSSTASTESMAIADQRPDTDGELSRAALANVALAQARPVIEQLNELYDVRVLRIGSRSEPATNWKIHPQAPLTALAGALRDARELRSVKGRPPTAVLVISDGAENAADTAAVRQVAEDLASQRTALLTVGVGPESGQTPLVELSPLVMPARVGLRDLLHVPIGGRAQGCRGHQLQAELLWDDQPAAAAAVKINYDIQHIELGFDTSPPGPGAHRLTVRLTLPDELGGEHFTTSTVVDVVADRVRVLYVEHGPHYESAFVTRAWRGDPTLDVERYFLFDKDSNTDGARALAELWSSHDVVVLGQVGSRLPTAAIEALAEAVSERGVGLLLSGGRELLNGSNYMDTALAKVSPVQLNDRTFGVTGPLRFVPTEAGLRHPALKPVSSAGGPAHSETLADEQAAWQQLPALGGAAALGPPKPAAVVLAEDEQGQPLLVAHEAGRGRCLAAAWESTWPWALASEAGSTLHQELWRQIVIWLANRRPQAWVVTDKPEYTLAALAGGEQRVQVRAGVSGLWKKGTGTFSRQLSGPTTALTLRRLDQTGPRPDPIVIALERIGDVWSAELPDLKGWLTALTTGTYVLEFFARVTDDTADPRADEVTGPARTEFTARTRFAVIDENLEQRAPTANLPLLRDAAERTTACGGRYVELAALSALLEELARKDDRQRVATSMRYDLVERDPWGLLLWLVFVLAIEWVLRKRSGLA